MKRPLILLSSLLFHSWATAAPITLEALEAKLRDVRFTSFVLENVSLEESLSALRKKAEETDEEPPSGTRGLNLILVPAAKTDPATPAHPPVMVSYSGKEVTLETVLREIAKTANQDVFLTSAGVVLVPIGLPPFPNPQAEKGEIFRKLTDDGKD